MKCVVPHQCLKTVVRAVWSLSKIGEEIYVEAQEKALYLKTTNCAKTAYVSVVFQKDFFLSYEYPPMKDPEHSLRCKLAMRPFLNIFKSLPNLEKLVDHCSITLEEDSTELVISFRYKLGFVKSHHLSYQDCEKLQAVFSKSDTHNVISGTTKVLLDVAGSFPASLDEVSVKACRGNLTFKSYCEDEQCLARVGLTEITLAAGEFEGYLVEKDTTVVFSLKTLRALLSFAEATAHDFDLRFEGQGHPAVLSLTNHCEYEMDVVMATLFEPEPLEPSRTGSQVSVEGGGGRKSTADSHRVKQEANGEISYIGGEKEGLNGTTAGGEGGPEQHFVEDDSTAHFLDSEQILEEMEFDSVAPLPSPSPRPVSVHPPQAPLSSQTGQVTAFSEEVPTGLLMDSGDFRDVDFGLAQMLSGSGLSSGCPKPPSFTDDLFGDVMDQDVANCSEREDVIPGTPEAKKKNGSILWTDESQVGAELETHEGGSAILAPDSDPDDF